MNSTRREDLKKYIDDKGEVKLKDLERVFNTVSSMTLRRDLQRLEEKGHIVRVRGGAISVKKIRSNIEEEYHLREEENSDLKNEIAKKAIGLLERERSIFLDSGSTVMQFAKDMPDDYFTIITSGANTAMRLLSKTKPSIVLTGGELNRNSISISGIGSLEFINLVNIDIAFIAASGFSLESGLTCGDYNESKLKKEVIRRAKKVVLLTDSTKVGKIMPYTFCSISDVDIIVSDKEFPNDIIVECERLGVKVI